MKTELTKQFVKKIIKKIVIFAFIMIILTSFTQSMSPVVSNNMALTQMQNSDAMFIMMNTYNKIKPIISAIYFGITVWFTYTIGRDIYKFVKTVNESNNEKEN
mgnify:CR=1 FL=1